MDQARTADGRGNTRKTEAIATGINVHRVSAVAVAIDEAPAPQPLCRADTLVCRTFRQCLLRDRGVGFVSRLSIQYGSKLIYVLAFLLNEILLSGAMSLHDGGPSSCSRKFARNESCDIPLPSACWARCWNARMGRNKATTAGKTS